MNVTKENLRFEQISKENEKQYQQLLLLWIPYLREIYQDEDTAKESDEELEKYARQRVNIQGQREDMFFELVYDQKQDCIGFLFYAVDLGGIKSLIPAGYGYIMEFYVIPKKRRTGFGTQMYKHIEENFKKLKVSTYYLTPDSKSGIPFWTAMGFKDCGKIDPDNQMPIYLKER